MLGGLNFATVKLTAVQVTVHTKQNYYYSVNENVVAVIKYKTMKSIGEWKYSSTNLDLCTRWRRVVSFKPQSLYLRGKVPRRASTRDQLGTTP
jgi:hypothetical protein